MLINVTYKKFCKIVINDETKINNLFAFISNYQADKFAVKEYLVLNHKILGKLNNLNFYNLFESNQRREIYFNIFQFLFLLIISLIYLYYSGKWLLKKRIEFKLDIISKSKFSLSLFNFIISLAATIICLKNPIGKYWIYIKKIELSKDLKFIRFQTFSDKLIKVKTSDVYFDNKKMPSYYSTKSFKKVFDSLVIGIKDKTFIIPLKNSIVNKDLLGICVRGYKLKI
jgi:hypothetical protein